MKTTRSYLLLPRSYPSINTDNRQELLKAKALSSLYSYLYSYNADALNMFYNIHSKVLFKIIKGHNPGATIASLSNYIEVNHRYSSNRFTKGYRIPALVRDSGLKLVEVPYKRPQSKHRFNPLEMVLHDILKKCTITMSQDELMRRIELLCSSGSYGKVYSFLNSYDAISHGDYTITTGGSSGRIYHTINQCPRMLRRYIIYQGQSLKEIDIKATFPYLLITFYSPNHPERQKYIDVYNNNDIYMFLSASGNRETAKVDFQRFISSRHSPNDIAELFQQEFPHLYSLLITSLETNNVRLQQLESTIMIFEILESLYKQNIPAIPIHDGMMVLNNDVELVKQMIIDQFTKLVGIPPRVEVK